MGSNFTRPLRKWLQILSFIIIAINTAGVFAQDGYISARSFAEAQGIAHQWFPIQKILVMRKGLKSVKLKLNDPVAIVDDAEVTLPAPPRIQDGQIMVPAAAMHKLFQTVTTMVPVMPVEPVPIPVAETPAPPKIYMEDSSEAVLLALRHSVREDHTRVVLEFTSPITYRTEFKNGNYRLTIVGCRNLIPTNRTNPAGRDVTKLEINSGGDRKGLLLSFILPQKDKQPTVETLSSPFRMIVSLPTPANLLIATATAAIASAPVQPVIAAKPVVIEAPKPEVAPEIHIEVQAATLSDSSFAGRTIIIDPGHGGNDHGFVFDGRPEEKNVNLSIAQHLKSRLEKIGFTAVLTRATDCNMSHPQRISFANRHGGDLYVSIHTGGSNDQTKAGVACYYFSPNGYFADSSAQGASSDAVFNEWVKGTRFDLALFIARKVNDRLMQHLKVESRGVKAMPILPLKFIMNPAILVEAGMLSDSTEGKNLISDNYRMAVAQAIANAVVDFFNGIVIKP